MTKKKKRLGWGIRTLVLGIAAVIDIFVPDPLILVDEILLIAGTILSFIMFWKKS